MKRNKVLLGLVVGLMTLAGGVASAQSGTQKDSIFHEVGPTNISGEVSSIVVDVRDTTGTSLFAGSVTGGLYYRSNKRDYVKNLYLALGRTDEQAERLADTSIWHYIPYRANDREVVLPISCMVQGPDGALYFGTGDAFVQSTSNYSRMSASGRGLFRFDPESAQFTLLPETSGSDFWAVNGIDYYYNSDNSTMYLFAATPLGLYRWTVANPSNVGNWLNASPERIREGAVDEIKIARQLRLAYFSAPYELFRIGDVAAANVRVTRLTTTNEAFHAAQRIRLAVSPTDPTYVYAMTIDANGRMENVYLTTDQQHWSAIATSTVTPLLYTSGRHSGAMAVDPANARRLIIAGDEIWIGQGYVPGALYQWTNASYCEYSLMGMGGDFMSSVYNSSVYVHSGIHCIVPALTLISRIVNGERFEYSDFLYYIGTDGGVFGTTKEFYYFASSNRGLNAAAINSVSVSPDGSLISGIRDNSSAIIEPHFTHVGGQPTISWFDNGSRGNLNHTANVIWRVGTGGATAASAFQQYAPQNRRTIFTSNADGEIGRTYADYLDYTNTTTWTIGTNFMTADVHGGPEIGSVYLWETDKNTIFNQTIRQGVDTLGYIIRGNDTLWVNDTIHGANRGTKFRIQRGDKVNFHSRAHNNYPFEYTFPSAQLAGDSVDVLNPIQSRMVCIADRINESTSGIQPSTKRAVYYSWAPTDFTKVFNNDEYTVAQQSLRYAMMERHHLWSPIMTIARVEGTPTANLYPRNAVISRDGLNVYVSAYDTETRQSMLFRISGFENVDFSQYNFNIMRATSQDYVAEYRLTIDTFRVDGSVYFPRPISSLAIDPREGRDRLIITFDDNSENYANVAVIDNPRTNWSTITQMPIDGMAGVPAFCALAEDSTGTIYVGTANGVYTKQGAAAWQVYENIPDMPVTAIAQQTKKLPIRRSLTHTGITPDSNVFAKTKWPRAIYFGTYGRGIFMDMTYVTDTVNEIVDSVDYTPVNIPTVNSIGLNSVSLYPNPVSTEAHLNVRSAVAGMATIRVYDLNGRCVIDRQLGFASEGENLYTLQTQNLANGMYLVNVIIGGHTAATKMMVR